MNTNGHNFTFISKNAALKINVHNFEVFFKHLQIMATLFEKVKISVCDILGDILVNVAWGVILKICFKFFSKKMFFSLFFAKKVRSLRMLLIWQPWWKSMVRFGYITRQYFLNCELALVLVLCFKSDHKMAIKLAFLFK